MENSGITNHNSSCSGCFSWSQRCQLSCRGIPVWTSRDESDVQQVQIRRRVMPAQCDRDITVVSVCSLSPTMLETDWPNIVSVDHATHTVPHRGTGWLCLLYFYLLSLVGRKHVFLWRCVCLCVWHFSEWSDVVIRLFLSITGWEFQSLQRQVHLWFHLCGRDYRPYSTVMC